jgi:hypothetical protein
VVGHQHEGVARHPVGQLCGEQRYCGVEAPELLERRVCLPPALVRRDRFPNRARSRAPRPRRWRVEGARQATEVTQWSRRTAPGPLRDCHTEDSTPRRKGIPTRPPPPPGISGSLHIDFPGGLHGPSRSWMPPGCGRPRTDDATELVRKYARARCRLPLLGPR